jgi:hypothetical protein
VRRSHACRAPAASLATSSRSLGCRLLVIGDDRYGIARLLLRGDRRVPWASWSRHACPSAGSYSRAWRVASSTIRADKPRSFAFRQASDTNHALASAVIWVPGPGEGYRRAPPSDHRPAPAPCSVGLSDDAPPGLDPTQASSIFARSTRLAGSVRDRAIDLSLATSSLSSASSTARRHAVMIFDPAPRKVRI